MLALAAAALVLAAVLFERWHGAHRPPTASPPAAVSRLTAAPTPPTAGNIYAAAGANMLVPAVAAMPPRI